MSLQPLDSTQDLKTHVALLGKDVSQMNEFVEKLDSAIDKLVDVSASIKELLHVHDLKLGQQSIFNAEILESLKRLREENHREHLETKEQIRALAARILSLEKWKYTVVGGSIVVGILLSHVEKFFS